MNRDEQKQILGFIKRALTGAPGVPMPEMDPEADAIIRALFVRNPEAAYRVTKLAIALDRELETLRAAVSVMAERRVPGPLGWFFTRQKAPGRGRGTELPAMEASPNV